MIALFRPREPAPNPVADELRAQLAAERSRNDELMRTIVELRRDGFQPPAPVTDMPTFDGLPDEVMAAIEERATNLQARERLMQYARRALRNGEVAEVAERIMQGEQGGFQW